MTVMECELTDMSAFEEQFRTDDSGGGKKNNGDRPLVTYPEDDSEDKKNETAAVAVFTVSAPTIVREAVCRVLTEEHLFELEEKWQRGLPLTQAELEILEKNEEDLRDD